MKSIIEEIVREVSSGFFFDAHFVISRLYEVSPEDYFREFPEDKDLVPPYHGRLALLIKDFEGSLVEQQEGMSWSKNINGNYNECSLWKRI
jgi:hypothetical protein